MINSSPSPPRSARDLNSIRMLQKSPWTYTGIWGVIYPLLLITHQFLISVLGCSCRSEQVGLCRRSGHLLPHLPSCPPTWGSAKSSGQGTLWAQHHVSPWHPCFNILIHKQRFAACVQGSCAEVNLNGFVCCLFSNPPLFIHQVNLPFAHAATFTHSLIWVNMNPVQSAGSLYLNHAYNFPMTMQCMVTLWARWPSSWTNIQMCC